jgi:hypothetical protein
MPEGLLGINRVNISLSSYAIAYDERVNLAMNLAIGYLVFPKFLRS